MVSLNSSAGLAVGIDFGHRHLRVAVSDLSHTVLAETWRELDVDHSADEGLATAVEFVDEVLAEAELDRARVIGVGMGLPAPIDRASGAVQARLDPARLGRRRRRGRGERPARAPGRGRQRRQPRRARRAALGRGRGRSEVAYIKVSSGIGAGLISGGRLQHGVGGTAGEIGHTLIAERGAGVPVRQPGLPGDPRLDPGDRGAAQRQPRRRRSRPAGCSSCARRATRQRSG